MPESTFLEFRKNHFSFEMCQLRMQNIYTIFSSDVPIIDYNRKSVDYLNFLNLGIIEITVYVLSPFPTLSKLTS